jgi:uncharacterized protein YbjT (DUF2867 family)
MSLFASAGNSPLSPWASHTVFITGATGYIGRALIPILLARGHRARALARLKSARRAAAYLSAREAGEAHIRASGVNATILRPWYVLGAGHRWPYFLVPFYAVFKLLPPTRDAALPLGLVTLDQMVLTNAHCLEQQTEGVRLLHVPRIRAAGETRS